MAVLLLLRSGLWDWFMVYPTTFFHAVSNSVSIPVTWAPDSTSLPLRTPPGLAQFSHRAHLKWDCVFWFPRIISSHISYSERGSIIPPVMDDAFTWFTPSRVPTSHGRCLHTRLHPWPTPSELNVLKPACLLLSRFLPMCFSTVASAPTQWLTVWCQKCRCHIIARLSGNILRRRRGSSSTEYNFYILYISRKIA